MLGFLAENYIGSLWYIGLLFTGGLLGNLLSAVCDPYDLGVGASTSLFAVLGFQLIWYCLNFERLGPYKIQFVIFFIVIVAFSLLNTFAFKDYGVDFYGHIGKYTN
jgi:membrane associated rhomboid family serine protease